MKILKFGGSSIQAVGRIKSVLEIIKSEHNKDDIVVVVSAFGGITNKLIQMSEYASAGRNEYLDILKEVQAFHVEIVKTLIHAGQRNKIQSTLNIKFRYLEDTLRGVYLIQELSDRTSDSIVSFGERLSAFIISECLIAQEIEASYLNASSLIKTDDNFKDAMVNFELTNANIKKYFESNTSLQIITGFIASTEKGDITTLGRSGSDYTASIFGAALQASEIEIWTDVDGVMTADPRIVPDAFSIESMSYEEAMEMSHFGSAVIHPKAMQPALEKDIPIRIRNTFNPEFKGTVVSAKSNSKTFTITGLSSISDIALLRVQGSGMLGVAGISGRLFSSLAKEKINVILITQGSSEHSISFAVKPEVAKRAKKLIEDEFSLEILARQIEQVVIEDHLSIIAVVGEKMRGIPGIAARIFQALGDIGISVVAVAQGSSELNISLVIRKENQHAALNAIHNAFFFRNKKSLHLFIVGPGLVGGTLIDQIRKQANYLEIALSLEIQINALANSKKMIFDLNGINQENWRGILTDSNAKMDIEELIDKMKEYKRSNRVFVDCTASDPITEYYPAILNSGISIVTPNKKANSGSYEKYQTLQRTAAENGVKFLYETNVGASLPILSALKDLILSGDRILRIATIISGTLSYVFNSFDGTKKFSDIVKDAKEKGYTEPDPRDDLNGIDVARKLLIIAREAGWKYELEDVKIENILPVGCQRADSVDQFFVELQKADDYFENLRRQAAQQNKVLRYIATLENEQVEIALQAVDRGHPFYFLNGSENIIAIETERYKESPLVVRGAGAGAELTAAGVFGDILKTID